MTLKQPSETDGIHCLSHREISISNSEKDLKLYIVKSGQQLAVLTKRKTVHELQFGAFKSQTSLSLCWCSRESITGMVRNVHLDFREISVCAQ